MKTLLILSTLLTSSILFAQDKDECSFDLKSLKTPFEKSKNFRSVGKESRDETEKTVTQMALLKSGEIVTFEGGGCVHANFSYTYKEYKLKDRMPKTVFKKAQDLLNHTDMTNSDVKNILLKSLKDAEKSGLKPFAPNSYPLACGDAQCVLELLGEGKKEELKLSYSFPL